MDLNLYNTISDNNVFNKILTDKETYQITLKKDTDIINPIIILKSDVLIDFNYAYINELKRFYFIDSITVASKNIYILNLSVDVLMSYKDDIYNSIGVATFGKDFNPYYDGTYPSLETMDINNFESDIQNFDYEHSFIVSTLGSGS